MNQELAKTLTTALVQFIDRERPEGTMCCSNTECERIESSFKLGDFPSIEQFVKKKLSGLTEFEQGIRDMIVNALTTVHESSNGQITSSAVIDNNTTHLLAAGLLELAKKELLKDDELGKKHLEGYIKGRNDALREMSDFMESHFNGEKARAGTQVVTQHMDNYNPQKFVSDEELAASSGTSALKAEG